MSKNVRNIYDGDIKPEHWLVLVEDDGYDGLGRVLGYYVFERESSARDAQDLPIFELCEGLLAIEQIESPPAQSRGVMCEVMDYADFRESYGDRMPLHNRGYSSMEPLFLY